MSVHNLRGPEPVCTNFDGTPAECEVHDKPRTQRDEIDIRAWTGDPLYVRRRYDGALSIEQRQKRVYGTLCTARDVIVYEAEQHRACTGGEDCGHDPLGTMREEMIDALCVSLHYALCPDGTDLEAFMFEVGDMAGLDHDDVDRLVSEIEELRQGYLAHFETGRMMTGAEFLFGDDDLDDEGAATMVRVWPEAPRPTSHARTCASSTR
jgi:hypothetical protein